MNETCAMGAWIAIGIGVGIALGVASGNLALSIATGATLGLISAPVMGRRTGGPA